MSEDMVERVARAISGAPFPSRASRRKARAAIEAMRYEDGTDEDLAIEVSSRKLGVDAVGAIEVLNAWIDAIMGKSHN